MHAVRVEMRTTKDWVIITLALSAGLVGGKLIRTGSITLGEALSFVLIVSALVVVGVYVLPELLKRLTARRRR
jgi:uncharacterized membrane protein (DUF485 family)